MSADVSALAREFHAAYASGRPLAAPPSAHDPGFDLATAYAVEAELVRLRRAEGRATVGRKVGFANKAMWRILKLDTLVWAHMYDDTVQDATGGQAQLALGHRCSPRIEPEIVFKLKSPMPTGTTDPVEALAHVDWLALGFEINDCLFPDWKFQPADFVAAFGLHTALVVGTPNAVTPARIPGLVDALPVFTLKLSRNGTPIEEGSGKNSLRSPALCLGELARAIAARPGATTLGAGELISTGTLTAAHPIAAGETWHVDAAGIDLEGLSLRLQ